MYIASLQLKNIRNQEAREISFSPYLNLIVGVNGAGKTTIIESIHSISTTKSFKANREIDIVSYEKDFGSILLTKTTDANDSLGIIYGKLSDSRVKKAYKINEVPKRMNSFIGELISVLFTTDVINSFTQLASTRRKFFNQFLSQLNKEYLSHLLTYEKIIRNKSRLLKLIREGADRKQLDYWNHELVQSGSYLIYERAHFITSLQEFFDTAMHMEKHVDITYVTEHENADTIATIQQKIFTDLQRLTDVEIISARCLVGPHKDDYEVCLNEKNIKQFASRGEQKLSMSFILYAIAMYIQSVTEQSPVVLLDDLSAEMDQKNLAHILDLFMQTKFQIIATAINELPYKKYTDTILQLTLGH
jgi:DNA replication and repair protein RecF